MRKELFIALVNHCSPIYTKCNYYKKFDNLWLLTTVDILKTPDNGKIYAGYQNPSKDVGVDKDIYFEMLYTVTLKKSEKSGYIDVTITNSYGMPVIFVVGLGNLQSHETEEKTIIQDSEIRIIASAHEIQCKYDREAVQNLKRIPTNTIMV